MPGQLLHRDVSKAVIGAFYNVHNELGVGFLESVYEAAMFIALSDAGLDVVRQCPVSVVFRGRSAGDFRADLLVERTVVVELKVCRVLTAVHDAQLINYLKASSLEVGLLLNFGLKPEFRRLVCSADRQRLPGRIERQNETA